MQTTCLAHTQKSSAFAHRYAKLDNDEVTPTMAPGHRKLPHYPKCEDTFGGVCEDSRGCDDDSRCFDGSECSTLAGEECDDWAGGESTETRGRCNGELDDADEDNKEDA